MKIIFLFYLFYVLKDLINLLFNIFDYLILFIIIFNFNFIELAKNF
jgi:hypothetical protein